MKVASEVGRCAAIGWSDTNHFAVEFPIEDKCATTKYTQAQW